MDRTKDEIIDEMVQEMPFRLSKEVMPYIREAMRIYANQEAKAYASWIANQVIGGRTSIALWNDYQMYLHGIEAE